MSTATVQNRLASMSINKKPLPRLEMTPTPLINQLLEKNDKEHHIFFGPSQFHNHFPHTLLSQFGLGAPESRIKKEWEIEDYLAPMPKKQSTEITDENWKQFIGKDEFYQNYLDYFKTKIAEDGSQTTLLKYLFDEDLLPCVVSGAVHPLIHLGFGVEFKNDDVVAEGLAEACVHSPSFAPVVDVAKFSKSATEKKSLLEIVDAIYEDTTFDGVVKYTDPIKSTSVLKSDKATEAIKDYVMQWSFDESEKGIGKAWSELFTLTTHFVASSAFPPPRIANDPKYETTKLRPLLDFFLVYFHTSESLIIDTR